MHERTGNRFIDELNHPIYESKKVNDIIKYNAMEQVNKIESVELELTNDNGEMKSFLKANDFMNLRAQNGRIISTLGMSAMGLIPTSNGYKIDVFVVMDIDQEFEVPNWVSLTSGSKVIKGKKTFSIITTYRLVEEGVEISWGYKDKNLLGQKVMMEIGEYKPVILEGLKSIPIKLFKNNSMLQSDIEMAGVSWELEQLDSISKEALKTFNRNNSKVNVNKNYSDNTAKELASKFESGQSWLEEDSDEAKFGLGVIVTPTLPGYEIIMGDILTLEETIKGKLGLEKDTINNGSNNLAVEIVTQNARGFEKMSRVQINRQKEYQDFLNMISSLTGINPVTVKLNLSILEQLKIETIKSSIMQQEMANANKNAQVESQNSQDNENNEDGGE